MRRTSNNDLSIVNNSGVELPVGNLSERVPIWEARPSVSVYILIYGIYSLIAIIILDVLEYLVGSTTLGSRIFPRVVYFHERISYPAEYITTLIVLAIYLLGVLNLLLLRRSNRYRLYDDGLSSTPA